MEYCSSDVMAYILYKGKQANHPINKTQAQKLLYCCYGIIMAKFNERLTDEHPKCWPFGPVFPRTLNDISKHRLSVGMAELFEKACDPDWLEWIDKTIYTFWNYSAGALSNWSHRKGSPWDKADSLAALDDREIGIYFKQYIDIVQKRGVVNG